MTERDSGPDADRPRVVLHIGEPKTGTTFLQHVMWSNRAELAGAGVMLPGARSSTHWRAAQDLRDVRQLPNDPIGSHRGMWDRLARQALRAPRTAVISHELFCAVNEQQAERAVRTLDGADVHVVLSVRDIGSLLPAEWQETVKHRSARGWDEWLADVIDRESGSDDRRQWWFWRVHDTIEILRVWGRHLPPENVHVLTVPKRGRGQNVLWKRFAGLLDVAPDVVDTSRARANASLGLPEIELIREVNQQLPDVLPNWFYMGNVKELLAHGALAERSAGPRLQVPEFRDDWVSQYANDLVATLKGAPYDVVGEADELLPEPVTGERPSPGEVSDEQQLDVAVDTIVALLVELAAVRGVPVESIRGAASETVDAADGAPVEQPPSPPGTSGASTVLAGPDGPALADAPRPRRSLKRTLIAVSERNERLYRLRRTYWHLRNMMRAIEADARARRDEL